jgi:hypothetical protein
MCMCFNAYNTLSYKRISLYTEYCYKTPEAILNSQLDRMQLSSGRVYYASLSIQPKALVLIPNSKKLNPSLSVLRHSKFKTWV